MTIDEERNQFRKSCAKGCLEDAQRVVEIAISCLYDAGRRIDEAGEWFHRAGDTKNKIYANMLHVRVNYLIDDLEKFEDQLIAG